MGVVRVSPNLVPAGMGRYAWKSVRQDADATLTELNPNSEV